MGVVKKWLGLDRKSQKKRMDAMKGEKPVEKRLGFAMTGEEGKEAAMQERWDEIRKGKKRKVDYTSGGGGRTLMG